MNDQSVNVQAAADLGIRGHHFTGAEKLAQFLAGVTLTRVAQ